MGKKTRRILAVALTLGLLASLTGCGAQPGAAFQMALYAPFADDEAFSAYGQQLAAALPGLTIDGEAPLFSAITTGTSNVDAQHAVGGMTKLTVMVTAKELDMVIADPQTAATHARTGMFYTLEDLFTAEQLAPVTDRLIRYEQTDEQGNPTGAYTAYCGVDLTGYGPAETFGTASGYGLYIVANAPHLDQAKEAFLYIIGQLA